MASHNQRSVCRKLALTGTLTGMASVLVALVAVVRGDGSSAAAQRAEPVVRSHVRVHAPAQLRGPGVPSGAVATASAHPCAARGANGRRSPAATGTEVAPPAAPPARAPVAALPIDTILERLRQGAGRPEFAAECAGVFGDLLAHLRGRAGAREEIRAALDDPACAPEVRTLLLEALVASADRVAEEEVVRRALCASAAPDGRRAAILALRSLTAPAPATLTALEVLLSAEADLAGAAAQSLGYLSHDLADRGRAEKIEGVLGNMRGTRPGLDRALEEALACAHGAAPAPPTAEDAPVPAYGDAPAAVPAAPGAAAPPAVPLPGGKSRSRLEHRHGPGYRARWL